MAIEKKVTIRNKQYVSEGAVSGWHVVADIQIGANNWSGPHFVPADAESDLDEAAVSAALLKQYGG